MAGTRIFEPRNGLAQILNDTGATFDELVDASQARLTALRGPIREDIRRRLAIVLAIHREGEAAARARQAEICAAALGIAEVAAAADLPALGDTARGLHAVLVNFGGPSAWRQDVVSVHVGSLALLDQEPPLPLIEAARIVADLRAMRAALGVVE